MKLASRHSARFVMLAVALLLRTASVGAETSAAADHLHAALAEDEALTASEVVDVALARYPATLELDARHAEAGAWRRRGSSLIAGRPSLAVRYQSDRFGDDRGLEEIETGIGLPLWRWGERSAVRSLGDAMQSASVVASDTLRWEVSGYVRAALWDIALADNDLALAAAALDTATELRSIVERRHELGDVALGDVLLAQTGELEAQTVLIEARAAMLDAGRAYGSLTGISRRPPFHAERQSTVDEIANSHPALALANAEIERAQATETVVEKSSSGAPQLLLGPRRERSVFDQAYEDSFGLTVTVPFGGRTHTRPAVAAAARETAALRARRDRLLRALDLQLHEAAHQLDVVRENLAAAAERAELAARRYDMGKRAYQAGEIDLIDLLRLQTADLAARRQAAGLLIRQKRQTAFYNQAVGDLL